MIALDTNVIVRFLVRDDEDQAARARTLIVENETLVCVSVILETEWVLRSNYGFSRNDVHAAFERFFGISGVILENSHAVASALRDLANGMDFADALHLATATDADRFASFDRKMFKKSANKRITVFEP